MRRISNKYPCQTFFNIQQSFDGKEYICKTCHSKVLKGELPCQAVFLKLELHVLFIAIKHGLKAEQRTKHDTF
ncbi:hypothetical protein pdam_00006061, partial [Pocillopora damicornis]